ncbi:MAG: hypothetical protein EOO45_08275 [Flavobacterium sp.]|nr:MAG: hypothetical protein EOO45_08275 [Flavobacterium sp.]
MVRKLLYLILLFPLLTGCENDLTYDGRTKIIYEGKLVDQEGNPLANIPVSIYVTKRGYFYSAGSDRDLISYATSDANGHYKMVFPQPENEDNISLLINRPTPKRQPDSTYSTTEIYNLKSENVSDYKLVFETTSLYKVENSVQLAIGYPVGNPAIVKLNLLGMVKDNIIDYNISYPRDESDYHNLRYSVDVAKNQMLIIEYQLEDGTTGQREVEIGDSPLHYIIEL